MKKNRKRWYAAFVSLCLAGSLVFGGSGQMASASTFQEINQDSVFLKQPSGSSLCTLVAATMLVRRGAMMNGNDNWALITTDTMRSAAWVEGTGLKWDFTCGGISVTHAGFSGSASDLQEKLAQHPEGVVLYKQKSDQQHAILVTDYTDGVFYCADPSGAVASGRIPISSASITVEESNYLWYVNSPALYLTDSAGSKISHAVETASPTASPTATPKATATAKPKATATAKPKATQKPSATKKTSSDKSGESVTAPQKVHGVKVKNNKKKTLTVTWEKTSGAKGYQIRFGKKKKLSGGAAAVTLTGRRAALTGLSKGSVFYVKVRAYKLNGKKKVYGSFSAVKKGKVKK